MNEDIFGVAFKDFQKKVDDEKKTSYRIEKIFQEIINQIKYTIEEDGWQRLFIFGSNNIIFKNISLSQKCMLLYYLRRNPNIISKLSPNKEGHSTELTNAFLFKWIVANQKEKLGINAISFENISPHIKEHVFKHLSGDVNSLVDVLSVLEILLKKNPEGWFEMNMTQVSILSGVPIENVCFAFNTLLKLKLIILGYTACKQKRTNLKLNVRVTLSEEMYKEASEGKGIDAVKILSEKDALNEKFVFSALNHFYEVINHQNKNETVINNIQKSSLETEKIYKTEVEMFDKNTNKKNNANLTPINIVMPGIKGLSETLNQINACVISLSDVTKTLSKNEDEKISLLNSFIEKNSQQRSEYNELYAQMVTMKKIMNKEKKNKYQIIKSVQDALNLLIGQIISEIDTFVKIPRHQLDEITIQKFKADIIKIVVKTADEIRRSFNDSQKPCS